MRKTLRIDIKKNPKNCDVFATSCSAFYRIFTCCFYNMFGKDKGVKIYKI